MGTKINLINTSGKRLPKKPGLNQTNLSSDGQSLSIQSSLFDGNVGGGGSQDLSSTLENGNQTDGNNIVLTQGDKIVGDEIVLESTDGTNTSEIKVNLTAPNGIVQTFTVDETGFPLGGYVGNVITFTQVSTDGNGTGLEFEVAFAGPGFIGTINFLNRGLNYEVGDIITTSNEGSGALTLTIDSIDDVDNYNRLYSTNGTNTGEIKVEKKSISQKVEQGSNVSEIIVEQNPNFGTQIVQASTDGTNEAYLVTNPTAISHQLSDEIDNTQMTIGVNGLSVYRTDNTNNLQTQFRVEDEVIIGFGTGTSIKVEPAQITQKVQSGDIVSNTTIGRFFYVFNNSINIGLSSRSLYINTVLNIGRATDVLIDPTPLPIVGYADQTIVFTQDSTDGNGTGLEVEVIFDNSGNIDSFGVIQPGEGYLIGDTVTSSDEGSGSLTFTITELQSSGIGLGLGEGNVNSYIGVEPRKIDHFVTDGDDTSEIKIEPAQIEQKVESGNASSQILLSNRVFSADLNNGDNNNQVSIFSRLNIGRAIGVSIDPTPFPIIGYANQTITFTQASTDGNGTGFSVDVEFDNSGDLSNFSINRTGEGYLIGDTITTTDEGSGALLFTVDEIETSTLQKVVSDGSDSSAIEINPALVSINTPQITLDTIALLLPDIPTYADNAAAVADSYPEHGVYKTSTGELRIVV
jgi:hypothetical protein